MDAQWRPEPEGDGADSDERRVLAALAEERQRLAGELHDSIGGRLSGIAMGLSALQRSVPDDASRGKLASLARAVGEGLEEIRTFSFALQIPTSDPDTPFEAVVERFAKGFAQRAGLALTLEVAASSHRLSEDNALVLIRVLQEALLNVHRHANATAITVHVAHEDGAAKLVVQDDGCGMDLVEGEPPSGAGLMSMRHRIKRAGGLLRFESSRAGTTVTACIPLQTTRRTGICAPRDQARALGRPEAALDHAKRFVGAADDFIRQQRETVARLRREQLPSALAQELLDQARELRAQADRLIGQLEAPCDEPHRGSRAVKSGRGSPRPSPQFAVRIVNRPAW